ncbi:O-antigen/teichoic acid export membrane protein [Novosphingobium hassiacum]|uniref:O-antigen/teichoic acid export membrane protein n=1 Tax=Novosphingobium hassiacum TaxID=173676 RepID=A0A7W5ZVE0_9SPHN|nr:O-antigen/teichoic acid export membrane protein [Novosphingobium hassiacum]
MSTIGVERYGALVIAWTLLGYFGQADFGIGRAVAQRIASSRNSPPDQIASVVWSGIVSMLILGGLGALFALVASGYYFGEVMKVEPGLRQELMRSLWALALCSPVVTLTGVLSGALIGMERFKYTSWSFLVSNLGLQILPLVAAATISKDLQWLVAASLIGRALGLVMMGTMVWRQFLAGQAVRPSWAEMRRLANFGAWIMVSALIGPLMIYSDRFIIGAIYGAFAVAVYTIPYQVAYRTLVLPQSVVGVLFPRFAALDDDEALVRCRQFTVFVGQLFAPFIIGLICLAEPLLTLWLGSHLDPRSVEIAKIILLGVWFMALANVPLALLQARGNPQFTAMLSISELPFYLGILFILGNAFGLAGIAWAFTLRSAADAVILAWRARAVDRWLLGHVAPTAALVLLSVLASDLAPGWFAAMALAAILVAACLAHLLHTISRMPHDVRLQFERLPLVRSVLGRMSERRAVDRSA